MTIGEVNIKAFYFLPQDVSDKLDANWETELTGALGDLRNFYQHQLHNAVRITFDVYPQPVAGLRSSAEYNGENTGGGNPNGLLAVREELLKRVFDPTGDLYRKSNFVEVQDAYKVMAILYEGVGSSATLFRTGTKSINEDTYVVEDSGPPAFLVSRYYLGEPGFKDYGTTIFAHEFGHTLGLADAYNLVTSQPFSEDIMGLGRFRPIQHSYLSQDSKKVLGLEF